ncbi:MAG: hypothetical protein DRP45_06350 [Candidatus Zixiibacteriota bacterium]|nr:MAG: hypothetical protein DRP45_06350 [candidate division Zixibacteria bacterium]
MTEENESNWVLVGSIGDQMSADFAKEVLGSYKIPAVVISKSGYFGQMGLTLTNIYKPGQGLFEVSVPENHVPEAVGILDMVLGDNWQREVN